MKDNNSINNKTKASLTIEAALILPIFIFAIIAFIYLLQLIIINNNFQESITNIGLSTAKYGYVYESISDFATDEKGDLESQREEGVTNSLLEEAIAKSISSLYYKLQLTSKTNTKALNKSIIKNEFSGVSTYLSSFMEKDNEVDIIINYDIALPVPFIKIDNFHIVQRVRLNAWTGYRPIPKFTSASEGTEETDENEEMVYITASGKVYHNSANCTHIKLSIKNVPVDQVKNLRNSSGGKYTSCYICGSRPQSDKNIYITTSGDRYHNDRTCSGLKRTVTKVPLKTVEDRAACKRCGK